MNQKKAKRLRRQLGYKMAEHRSTSDRYARAGPSRLSRATFVYGAGLGEAMMRGLEPAMEHEIALYCEIHGIKKIPSDAVLVLHPGTLVTTGKRWEYRNAKKISRYERNRVA